MPHSRYEWRAALAATIREYKAVRLGLDLLADATDDEIREKLDERGWDEPEMTESNAAENHLDATYLIRPYSVFERAVGSFWRQMPGRTDGEVDGRVMLGEVGGTLAIEDFVVASAQEVRNHRNKLVHRRLESHAGMMTLENSSRDLIDFLNALPPTWD